MIAIDLETTGLHQTDKILLVSITTEKGTYVVSGKHEERLKKFFTALAKSNELVVAHNAAFEGKFIKHHYGVTITNWYDTMLVSQICHNGKGYSHSLSNCLKRAKLPYTEDKKTFQTSFLSGVVTRSQIKYAADDTRYLFQLKKQLDKLVAKYKLETVLALEHKLLPVLIDMQYHGIKMDKAGWLAMIPEWEREQDRYIKILDDYVAKLKLGGRFSRKRQKATVTQLSLFGAPVDTEVGGGGCINYSSNEDLETIFKHLGALPVDKHGEVSFGEDAIVLWSTINGHEEFISALLGYREYGKLISTYGLSFVADRIYPSYKQCHAQTGRLASNKPNIQNIPAMEALRNKFIPDNEDSVFITCDMSSAEVRIAASMTKEPLLLAAILEGADMHSELSSMSYSIIFGEDVVVSSKGTWKEYSLSKLRNDHKPVVFAYFYLASAGTIYGALAKYINKYHKDGLAVAKKIKEGLDKRLPKLYAKLKSWAEFDGEYMTITKFGRIRFIKDTDYASKANAPIQGTNAEAMKVALIKAHQYLGGWGRVVLTVHDEIVVQVPRNRADEAAVAIQSIMADSLGYFLDGVPGAASVKIADYWVK